MHITSSVHTQHYCSVYLKTFTLAGFEPGSSVPEADEMSIFKFKKNELSFCKAFALFSGP
jgi:hypothetical protein